MYGDIRTCLQHLAGDRCVGIGLDGPIDYQKSHVDDLSIYVCRHVCVNMCVEKSMTRESSCLTVQLSVNSTESTTCVYMYVDFL